MKRYRLHWWSFETIANILNIEIKEEWEIQIKEQWLKTKEQIIFELKIRYWEINFDKKLENFKEAGSIPLSVIYYHNNFFSQIRDSFVVWSYYPALTGACSLWERILNHLINELKENFRKDIKLPDYKYVYQKKVFYSTNWDKMINILNYWNILEEGVFNKFIKLKNIRNLSAVHFNLEIEDIFKLREISLDSIKIMHDIINLQFWWIWENKKWLIENTKWVFFIKKEYENYPFVKNIIIPNCVLVWNKHKVECENWNFIIIDNFDYWDWKISDEEFAQPYL